MLHVQTKKTNMDKNSQGSTLKPTFGSAYLDDSLTQFTTIHYSFHVINIGYDINRGYFLKRVVIDIRASKNIQG